MQINGFSKIIRVLLFVTVLTECDTPSALLVNDFDSYSITSEHGSVKISGSTLENDRITLSFMGDFVVNIDSLKIKANGFPVERNKVSVLYKNKIQDIPNESIHICGNDTVSVIIKNIFPLKYSNDSFIDIMPSTFILCDNVPLIKNVIRIRKK